MGTVSSPATLSPLRNLLCCCCGGRFIGRQFHNQDTGHGMGPCCADRVLAHRPFGHDAMTLDEFERDYGKRGIHFDIPPESPAADQTSNWTPLLNLIGEHLAESFMFMGESCGIFLYKHAQTRQYLNIDRDGCTYAYAGNCNGYSLISPDTAILHAFDLNSGLLTERDRGHLIECLAKSLHRPTEGPFASLVWEWSNSRSTPSDLAARTMRAAGYRAFEGYPLVRA